MRKHIRCRNIDATDLFRTTVRVTRSGLPSSSASAALRWPRLSSVRQLRLLVHHPFHFCDLRLPPPLTSLSRCHTPASSSWPACIVDAMLLARFLLTRSFWLAPFRDCDAVWSKLQPARPRVVCALSPLVAGLSIARWQVGSRRCSTCHQDPSTRRRIPDHPCRTPVSAHARKGRLAHTENTQAPVRLAGGAVLRASHFEASCSARCFGYCSLRKYRSISSCAPVLSCTLMAGPPPGQSMTPDLPDIEPWAWRYSIGRPETFYLTPDKAEGGWMRRPVWLVGFVRSLQSQVGRRQDWIIDRRPPLLPSSHHLPGHLQTCHTCP